MKFKTEHLFFKNVPPEIFTDDALPFIWAHPSNKWWFDDYVFKLKVGEHIDSDFQRVTRIE